NICVMACGDKINSILMGVPQELFKFNTLVAQHAGIWGQPGQIDGCEWVYHLSGKLFLEVKKIERNLQVLSYPLNRVYLGSLFYRRYRKKEMKSSHFPSRPL
ncbi:MAG: hypothetical protein ABII26_10500, partial [Pseudomonadota bacterium]